MSGQQDQWEHLDRWDPRDPRDAVTLDLPRLIERVQNEQLRAEGTGNGNGVEVSSAPIRYRETDAAVERDRAARTRSAPHADPLSRTQPDPRTQSNPRVIPVPLTEPDRTVPDPLDRAALDAEPGSRDRIADPSSNLAHPPVTPLAEPGRQFGRHSEGSTRQLTRPEPGAERAPRMADEPAPLPAALDDPDPASQPTTDQPTTDQPTAGQPAADQRQDAEQGQVAQAAAAERERRASRPAVIDEAGSLADLRYRLESLPAGHPSSPYTDDGTRKPPAPRLKHLELAPPGRDRSPEQARPAAVAVLAATDSEPEPAGALPAWNGAHTSPGSADPPPASELAQISPEPMAMEASRTDRRPPQAPDLPPASESRPPPLEPLTATSAWSNPRTPPAHAESRGPADPAAGYHGPRAAAETTLPGRHHGGTRPASENSSPPSSATTPDLFGHSGSAGRPPSERGQTAAPPARGDELAVRHNGPLAGPDGSWSWGSAYLSPDQVAIADDLHGRLRAAEGRTQHGDYSSGGLTATLRRIEAGLEHGRLAPDRGQRALIDPDIFKAELAGLVRRYPEAPAEDLARHVNGALSYALVFDPAHYSAGIWLVHDVLRAQGFRLEARRNGWAGTGPKGVVSTWLDPSFDVPFQVQFHTTASFAAQQLARSSANAIRDPRTPPAEAARLRSDLASAWATLASPAGTAEIGDYRRASR